MTDHTEKVRFENYVFLFLKFLNNWLKKSTKDVRILVKRNYYFYNKKWKLICYDWFINREIGKWVRFPHCPATVKRQITKRKGVKRKSL